MRRFAPAILVVALIAIVIVSSRDSHVPESPAPSQERATVPQPEASLAARPETLSPANVPLPTEPEDGACFSIAQLETHPAMFAEAARLESVASTGDFLKPLEGASDAFLRQLATQGDAAAMLMLGARAELAADGMDPANAVRLLGHKVSTSVMYPGQSVSNESKAGFEQAAEWYYRAALHGRIMALQNYGRVHGNVEAGPVGLGWVTESEYEALSGKEKSALFPNNVYGQLTSRIAPELNTGLGALFSGMLPSSERQAEILAELHREFEQRRIAAGLPPVRVPASNFWSEEELLALVCESEKHHLQ